MEAFRVPTPLHTLRVEITRSATDDEPVEHFERGRPQGSQIPFHTQGLGSLGHAVCILDNHLPFASLLALLDHGYETSYAQCLHVRYRANNGLRAIGKTPSRIPTLHKAYSEAGAAQGKGK